MIRTPSFLLLALALGATTACQSILPENFREEAGSTRYLPSLPAPPPAAAPAIAPAGRPSPPAPGLSPAAWPADAPAVVARSAIVVDAATGRVLYEKDPDTPRAVASTQKLLTALIITGSGGLDASVTVAQSDTEVEPSLVGIKTGERYTRRALLEALLVRSGNDIAHCLARTHSGSIPAFADEMNNCARSLGMYRSNFANPSGLPAEGQYSTARDLSLLARAALYDPLIAATVRKRTHVFHFADGRVTTLENTNELLEKSPWCHGVKTGYTRASGRCLISCGTAGGRTVIVVVLRSGWDEVWTDSKNLLHWALGVS